jgi:hypothetical protein
MIALSSVIGASPLRRAVRESPRQHRCRSADHADRESHVLRRATGVTIRGVVPSLTFRPAAAGNRTKTVQQAAIRFAVPRCVQAAAPSRALTAWAPLGIPQ